MRKLDPVKLHLVVLEGQPLQYSQLSDPAGTLLPKDGMKVELSFASTERAAPKPPKPPKERPPRPAPRPPACPPPSLAPGRPPAPPGLVLVEAARRAPSPSRRRGDLALPAP